MTTTTDPAVIEADAEIAKTRSKIEALMGLLPGLESRRAEAADRKRREAVTALREQIEPTLGADTEALRIAMRALERAVADVVAASSQHNTRITGYIAEMVDLGIPTHPQGAVAPVPSPEYASLGHVRSTDDATIIVEWRRERVVNAADLVAAAVASGKNVAAGSEPDRFAMLDNIVKTIPAGPAKRYFLAEVGDQHQVCPFDAAQVDSWAPYQHARFVAEITEKQAFLLGWNLARVENRAAGGVEIVPTEPGR